MPANLPSGVEVVDSDGDLLIIVMPEGSTVSKEVQAQNNDETGQTGNQGMFCVHNSRLKFDN